MGARYKPREGGVGAGEKSRGGGAAAAVRGVAPTRGWWLLLPLLCARTPQYPKIGHALLFARKTRAHGGYL